MSAYLNALREEGTREDLLAEVEKLYDANERLRAALAWTDEVRPGALPWGGANVEMTWEQFNAMRQEIGLKPQPVPAQRRRNVEQTGDAS